MGEEADVVAMSQFQLAPSVIQGQSRLHTRDMLSEVQDLLGRLTSLRMQHLFMIQASPRYCVVSDAIIMQASFIHRIKKIVTRISLLQKNLVFVRLEAGNFKIFSRSYKKSKYKVTSYSGVTISGVSMHLDHMIILENTSMSLLIQIQYDFSLSKESTSHKQFGPGFVCRRLLRGFCRLSWTA